MLLDLLPGELGCLAGPLPRLARMAARGGALEHPLHDALADAGDAEQVVRHAELPYRGLDRSPPGAPAIVGNVVRLAGNAELAEVDALQARDLARAHAPEHHVVGEVRERMSEGRELPVDEREHARPIGSE